MARTRKRTGHGQLLLLAALLLGIVTMHTLGHPSGEHPSAAHTSGGHGASHGAASHRSPGPDMVLELKSESPPQDGAAGMGMDPLSVCLAVLGALTLVLLLWLLVRAGLSRPGGTLARAPTTGRPNAPRPEAPPPRVPLSRLSVLRI
ncbi:DUF6153 family protein [Streptomyces sp. G5(2025)]|uniref:DUF6153 family protein n=1 Tax=Streptomyces sp. G5(2025) TaxID=3406628 RepID=UPI003C25F6BE